MSPGYYKRLKARRLVRSLKGVAARLAKHAAESRRNEPVRVDRVVEITIRDSRRPMTVIRLRREDQGERWGRWSGIGKTKLGPSGVGKLIGKYLE